MGEFPLHAHLIKRGWPAGLQRQLRQHLLAGGERAPFGPRSGRRGHTAEVAPRNLYCKQDPRKVSSGRDPAFWESRTRVRDQELPFQFTVSENSRPLRLCTSPVLAVGKRRPGELKGLSRSPPRKCVCGGGGLGGGPACLPPGSLSPVLSALYTEHNLCSLFGTQLDKIYF